MRSRTTKLLLRVALGLLLFTLGPALSQSTPDVEITARGLVDALLTGFLLLLLLEIVLLTIHMTVDKIRSTLIRSGPASQSAVRGHGIGRALIPRTIQLRARHEAAHAVAALVLGHRLQQASTLPEGASGGRVRWSHAHGHPSSIDHVTITLIGPIAEGIGDVLDAQHGTDDHTLALRQALAASSRANQTLSVVEILDHATHRARQLLKDYEDHIEAVTQMLIGDDLGGAEHSGDDIILMLTEHALPIEGAAQVVTPGSTDL